MNLIKKIVLITIVFVLNGCRIFDKDERLLAELQRRNGEKIGIYYVSLGATTNDVIQVRKSTQDNHLIWALDKYNYLKSSKLINDTILQMVLCDTAFGTQNKLDTLLLKLK